MTNFNMNTQTQKALKLAIEQMQHLIKIYIPSPEWSGTAIQEDCYETIQACKEALASNSEALATEQVRQNDVQPAQEPVAWISVKDKLPDVGVEVLTYDTHHEKKYFLNSIIIDKVDKFYFNGFTHWMPLPSAPNEINTHPAPSCQECENLKHDLEGYMDANKALINREWQGLSDDDMDKVYDETTPTREEPYHRTLLKAHEQALKEKNT